MSSKHLSTGSVEPPRKEKLLRVYSMGFCPYAQRARLILKAKKLPHDIVNINLINKPEWYSKIHPEGKVPTLLHGDKVITESLDICDYLDETFPENPLYPAEPASKKKDKELIQKIGPVATVLAKCLFGVEEKPAAEWLKELVEAFQPLEDELSARGTKFFGGDQPNMIDYMLWPWGEREESMGMRLGVSKLQRDEAQTPLLRKWKKTMLEDPVAAELYLGPDIFWKFAQLKRENVDFDYDSILA